jgi:hypothetical protein
MVGALGGAVKNLESLVTRQHATGACGHCVLSARVIRPKSRQYN